MPTNEQRRLAAKRKLERQLERRQEGERKRRRLTAVLSALGVVLLIGIVVGVTVLTRGSDEQQAAGADTPTSVEPPDADAPEADAPDAPPELAAALPAARETPLPATVECTYTPTPDQPASKPNTPPDGDAVSAEASVDVSIATDAGDVPVTLDRALAPCTVESFLTLADQEYFDDTPCHRLTTEGIKVLQCGDPTGQGTGGPGYSFANEFPTDQFEADDPAAASPANYARGTLAMANSGPDTNGSQFFLVYDDSPLPPQYTVFGTIAEGGLDVLDTVAEAGVEGGATDGAPATPVTLSTVRPAQ